MVWVNREVDSRRQLSFSVWNVIIYWCQIRAKMIRVTLCTEIKVRFKRISVENYESDATSTVKQKRRNEKKRCCMSIPYFKHLFLSGKWDLYWHYLKWSLLQEEWRAGRNCLLFFFHKTSIFLRKKLLSEEFWDVTCRLWSCFGYWVGEMSKIFLTCIFLKHTINCKCVYVHLNV